MKRRKTFITEIETITYPNSRVSKLSEIVFPFSFDDPRDLPYSRLKSKQIMRNVVRHLNIRRYDRLVHRVYLSPSVTNFVKDSFWVFFLTMYPERGVKQIMRQYGYTGKRAREVIKEYKDEIFRRMSLSFAKFTLRITSKYCQAFKDYFMGFYTEFVAKCLYISFVMCFSKDFLDFQKLKWKKAVFRFFNKSIYGLDNILSSDREICNEEEECWMLGNEDGHKKRLIFVTSKEEKERLKKAITYSRKERRKNPKLMQHVNTYDGPLDELVLENNDKDYLFMEYEDVNRGFFSQDNDEYEREFDEKFPVSKMVTAKKLEKNMNALDSNIIISDEPIEDSISFKNNYFLLNPSIDMSLFDPNTPHSPRGNMTCRTPRDINPISYEIRKKKEKKIVKCHKPVKKSSLREVQFFKVKQRKKKWYEVGNYREKDFVTFNSIRTNKPDRKFQAFSKKESPYIRNYLLNLHSEQQKERMHRIFSNREVSLYQSTTSISSLASRRRLKRPTTSYHLSRKRPKTPNFFKSKKVLTSRPKTTGSLRFSCRKKKKKKIRMKKRSGNVRKRNFNLND